MNEATFEQNISSEIVKHFPFLSPKDIINQKTFSIKFGHKEYKITDDTVKGRLDVMVQHKGIPLAIFELKAPEIPLSDDDLGQCVSYARLTEPMTPLAIVSNGKETIIVDTYTKNRIDKNQIKSIETFEKFIKNVSRIAAAELDSAIEILLGNDDKLWSKVVQEINDPVFFNQKGSISNLEIPICDEFIIERRIAKELLEKTQTESVIILTGDPFSGKTNVMYQLYHLAKQKDESIPIYIDLSEPKSIFQYLSNKFSSFLTTPISKDNFRHWLMNSLCKDAKHRIVFILDNIYSSIESDWEEIYELFEINQANIFSVLLVMNDQIYDNVKYIKGKQTLSALGKAYHCLITPLSDDEFDNALRIMDDKYKIQIHHGGQFNPEYRKPDMLKLMIASASKKNQHSDDETRLLLPSLTDTGILLSCWRHLSSDIQSGYRAFARYVIEQNDKLTNPAQYFMTYGSGVLFVSPHNQILETKYMQDLLSYGFVKKECLNDGIRYLYPVLPNAISVAAAFELRDIIMSQHADEELYRSFIKYTQLFPNHDLTAALVILLASQEDVYFITRIINRLVDDMPTIEYATPKRILIKTSKGICNLDLSKLESDDEDDSGVVLGNGFPWLVLSNLLSYPFCSEDGDISLWLRLIIKIGSFKNVLLRVNNIPFEEINKFHVHSIPGQIEVICGKMGIIEPITYSIQQGFTQNPQAMMKVVEWAVEHGNISLKMRLTIAIQSLDTITDIKINSYVKKAISLLSKKK